MLQNDLSRSAPWTPVRTLAAVMFAVLAGAGYAIPTPVAVAMEPVSVQPAVVQETAAGNQALQPHSGTERGAQIQAY